MGHHLKASEANLSTPSIALLPHPLHPHYAIPSLADSSLPQRSQTATANDFGSFLKNK